MHFRSSPVLIVLTALLIATISSEARQSDLMDTDLLNKTWDAHWIMHPSASTTDFGVFHFRRSFELDTIPDSFVIHVSGDTRYRLFINGKSVSKGPAVGDKHNWRFETVDIAEYLHEGKNIAAATVWNFGEHNAISHHSYRTAFLLQGNSENESIVNTNSSWFVKQNDGYSPIPVSYQTVAGYYAAPPGEKFVAEHYPHGWMETGYDVTEWETARTYQQGQPRGTNPYGNLYGWNLVPRNIPMMEEHKERILELRRTEGIAMNGGFLEGTEPLEVPADSRVVLLVDQTYIINAYPVLIVSGGRDAEIRLIYAEALREADNTKGNRNEIEGKEILGFHDSFILNGGQNRTLQPLWLRSYRYIQLEIETASDPLILHDMYGIFTGYPFEENARFASSDESLDDIWEAGWRTARLNAFESYWDCAYYEQLQYVGDTRIQALISLYVSGDDRLMRNAIEHFNDSRMPDGITMSRYPSHHPQYIPPYSLLWISMVHDYWMHRDDDEFVKQFLPGIRSVINWYEEYLDDELDLLGPMPWWNYVDAAQGFDRGTPPGSDDGNSIVISLQILYVLDYAAELAEAYGNYRDAGHYRELMERLQKSILKYGWNTERQLIADTPDQNDYSQQANILAVLTGVVPEDQQKNLMERILVEEDLVQATYYFRFYLFRAMRKAGLGNQYLDQLDPWYDALALGMTTFPEHPEPSRSDAHAWSSSPNYDFFATVAGIRPYSPGFSQVLIEPQPGALEWIQAAIPHPKGNISVDFSFDEDSVRGEINLPDGLTGRFTWNGREIEIGSGLNQIEMK
ncbi:alpha-L-rhamnosidase C-terminal domain-containing protein [Rhodohalobacter sp. SW132]|uniref:alpha-L-rhamnosidase-related protein n=1 Tax=Rhodohalobacter sp. SW132 TaxID=2293433 RepID=UPI001314B389|nr:alpha-L-rhamnosidase C-terminal domain-containing protein [Rhodohalobacter sp. SW132]